MVEGKPRSYSRTSGINIYAGQEWAGRCSRACSGHRASTPLRKHDIPKYVSSLATCGGPRYPSARPKNKDRLRCISRRCVVEVRTVRLFLSAQLYAAVCCLLVSAAFPQTTSTARQRPGADSWITHTDPSGFAVDVPSTWSVAKDPASGRIVISGTRGERAVIWPLLLRGVQLDSGRAAVLLAQLARKVDAQMPWGSVQPLATAARAFASSGQRSGAALLSWANGAGGASAYLYCLEAPANVYRATTDSFTRILNTFHIVQDPAVKNLSQSAAGAGATLTFVNWTDPREGAFAVAVPRGWQVIGG